jgi:hypothetical protein
MVPRPVNREATLRERCRPAPIGVDRVDPASFPI